MGHKITLKDTHLARMGDIVNFPKGCVVFAAVMLEVMKVYYMFVLLFSVLKSLHLPNALASEPVCCHVIHHKLWREHLRPLEPSIVCKTIGSQTEIQIRKDLQMLKLCQLVECKSSQLKNYICANIFNRMLGELC